MKTPKPISHDSYNEGAAEERRLWMRKLKIMQERWVWYTSTSQALEELRKYGEGRIKRNGLKKGGL